MQYLPETENHKYEHVFFYSDDLETVELTTIDEELEQSVDGAVRRLTIFNDTYLRVRSTDPRSSPREYWLNLAFLDPGPVRRLGPLWSAVAIVSGLLALGAFAVLHSGIATTASPVWAVSVPLMIALTLTSLGIGVHRCLGRLVFLTRHGRVPVLWLSTRSPDRQRVRRFRGRLVSAIQRAVTERSPDRGPYLRDEMKEHRRLREHGVLQAQEFQTARALILRAHG